MQGTWNGPQEPRTTQRTIDLEPRKQAEGSRSRKLRWWPYLVTLCAVSLLVGVVALAFFAQLSNFKRYLEGHLGLAITGHGSDHELGSLPCCCSWGPAEADGLTVFEPTDASFEQFQSTRYFLNDTTRLSAQVVDRVRSDIKNGSSMIAYNPCPRSSPGGLLPDPVPGWHTCYLNNNTVILHRPLISTQLRISRLLRGAAAGLLLSLLPFVFLGAFFAIVLPKSDFAHNVDSY
eukprot:TRINITY_DN5837_c1_g1_i1.p1 TRINITY_DN5837_c1_g1~~TRINITY_DN5837_c1_g1_i1.p1  ORF type:complete len:233 (+),score=13.03 TRINITY_DN5837_c1_g1_i1:244-942(+)